jgi:hypothetical protein
MLDNLLNVFEEEKCNERKEYESASPVFPSNLMRQNLFERFRSKIIYNPALDRKLVSFQANKQSPFYSWFKYREGFSCQLVQYLLQTLMPQSGTLLDPFAGGGSALFAARDLGWSTQGIEALPVGVYAMEARIAAERLNVEFLKNSVKQILNEDFSKYYDSQYALNHIPITNSAYHQDEEKQLVGYTSYCNQYIGDDDIKLVLLYAAFCILEDISYTRKDGQYLRWDVRSGRSQGKTSFNKGIILSFRKAIESKLSQILEDLTDKPKQGSLFEEENISQKPINIFSGSSLEILPTLPESSIDFVLTSPPYANRYDYTRTYALELVYLGYNSEEVKNLRQMMLSCTVENKDKRQYLEDYYRELNCVEAFHKIETTFNCQAALQEVLSILDTYRDKGELNNSNIVRLVRNYFYEMCFVIYELARLTKPGGIIAMVNDNVRYAGEEIPVDLILSDFAESFGLKVNFIWTLGRGKGNSSQQMGNHGRTELRKCVYVWEKSAHDYR